MKSIKLRMDKYKGDESNAWALIYDQCSPELKNKLKGTEGYDGAKSTNNVAKPLTMICGYCCQFDLLSNEYMAIVAAIKNLFYPCSPRSKSLSLNIEYIFSVRPSPLQISVGCVYFVQNNTFMLFFNGILFIS